MPATRRCSVVLIHGIGDHSESWAQPFRDSLRDELGDEAGNVMVSEAYWAPLSTPAELSRPSVAGGRLTIRESGLEDEAYRRTTLEFSRMLAAETGAPVDVHAFGPFDILQAIRERLPAGPDLIADVANYVARNGVRTGVQSVLHAALGEAHAADGATALMLVSHSQGTVIAYDVLRQAGPNYPALQTWITMGSPLRKYFAFPLEWGRRQFGMPAGLRWLNLYDAEDIVGKDLAGAVDWTDPTPEDRLVDNVSNAADAHDHWHNPQVVQAVVAEIRKLIE